MRIFEGERQHDTWTRAYGEPEFRAWLRRQKLAKVTWPVDVMVWDSDKTAVEDYHRRLEEERQERIRQQAIEKAAREKAAAADKDKTARKL